MSVGVIQLKSNEPTGEGIRFRGRNRADAKRKALNFWYIKTSGGKYVAPQELEGKLKTKSVLIGQVVVHGNTRNFCSALITLDPDALDKWAADHDKAGRSMADLVQDAELIAEVQSAIDTLYGGLASYETIKKFALLPEDFTIEGGELTPSMKVKRKFVERKYADTLDGFYGGALQEV